MAIVFVLLLGFGVNFLVGGYKRTTSVAQRNQAYYLAEAGVEEALRELQGGCREIPTTSPFSFPSPSPIGQYQYFVDYKGGQQATITSKGEVDTTIVSRGEPNKKTVTLRVTVQCGLPSGGVSVLPPLDMAVFANQSIKLWGSASITGSVGINSTDPGSIVLDGNPRIYGTAYVGPGGNPQSVISYPNWQRLEYFIQNGAGTLDTARAYSLPPFPEFPENLPRRGSLTIRGGPGNDAAISEDGYYDSISIQSDRKLTIKVDEEEVRILRVKHLDIQQGHIIIEGIRNPQKPGKVVFYVEDSFELGGSSRVNENGNMGLLTFFYKGSNSLNFAGDTRLVGTFCAERANITLGGSGGVVGLIITGGSRVVIQGDASAYVRTLYAPQAVVEMQGSGKLKGTIIANQFEGHGSTSVEYAAPPQDFVNAFNELFSNAGLKPTAVTEWQEM